jgi:hypothetical protein
MIFLISIEPSAIIASIHEAFKGLNPKEEYKKDISDIILALRFMITHLMNV